jgi:hypothetical protein
MTEKAQQKPITADEIRAQHEINGARRANTNLLAYVLAELKPGDERTNVEKLAAMALEREEAVASLRHLAEIHGAGVLVERNVGRSLGEIIEELAKAIGEPRAPEKSKR